MVQSLAINPKIAALREKEYRTKLKELSSEGLIQELLSYLDYEEESDSGRVFHPIYISSTRALISPCIAMLIKEMRKRV
jgi:hypothetical protein